MLLTLEDLEGRDELLGPVVSSESIDEAHEALYSLAKQCNVASEDITATFWVKRYITAYAFHRTAILKSYSAGGSTYRGGDDKDAYAQKIAIYAAELKELKATVTAEALTGSSENNDGSFRAVRLYRG